MAAASTISAPTLADSTPDACWILTSCFRPSLDFIFDGVKKITDSCAAFRADKSLWWQVVDYPFWLSPSAAKSCLRAEVRRQASPIVRPDCGSAKRSRQRQHHSVEFAGPEFAKQDLGSGLAHVET